MKFSESLKKNKDFQIVLLSVLAGFLSGFFGGGGGIVFIFILKKYFGEEKDVFPTTIFLTFTVSALCSTVYDRHTALANFSLLGYVMGIIGAIFGCIIFNKLKYRILNLIFSLLIMISGLMMILRG